MSNPSENHKDVFAHFGRAAYHAQCFQMELKNICLLLIRVNNPSLSIPILEQFEAILNKQTLGTLVRDIRKIVSFDDGCVSAIEAALANRNSLMHGFYERHATDLLLPIGREAMIRELRSTAKDSGSLILLPEVFLVLSARLSVSPTNCFKRN